VLTDRRWIDKGDCRFSVGLDVAHRLFPQIVTDLMVPDEFYYTWYLRMVVAQGEFPICVSLCNSVPSL
jgi:hypothetical protein